MEFNRDVYLPFFSIFFLNEQVSWQQNFKQDKQPDNQHMLWNDTILIYIWEAKSVHWGTGKAMLGMEYEKCPKLQKSLVIIVYVI